MVLGIVWYGSFAVMCKLVAVVGLRVLLDCSTWPGRQLLFVVVGPPANVRVPMVTLLAVPPASGTQALGNKSGHGPALGFRQGPVR